MAPRAPLDRREFLKTVWPGVRVLCCLLAIALGVVVFAARWESIVGFTQVGVFFCVAVVVLALCIVPIAWLLGWLVRKLPERVRVFLRGLDPVLSALAWAAIGATGAKAWEHDDWTSLCLLGAIFLPVLLGLFRTGQARARAAAMQAAK